VYSTDKDFVEQDYEVDEWDKKFRELERSDWEASTVIRVKQFNHYIWIMYFNVASVAISKILPLQWLVICMKISGSHFVIHPCIYLHFGRA
jgi:hypothetical protein